MNRSIDAGPGRRADQDPDPWSSDGDLFADDPFDAPRDRDAGAEPEPRGRAGKRRVIVDDDYGWGDDAEPSAADMRAFGDDEPEVAPEPRRSARRGASVGAVEQLPAPLIDPAEPFEPSGGGGVWWWAILASLIWVGGVLAFSVGFFRLPIQPLDALLAEAQRLDVKLQIMVAAAALAPIGLIWMHALNARRARTLATEAKRLARLASKISASAGAGGPAPAPISLGDVDVDPHALRVEVEGAARALDALEEKFSAAEDRAQRSRERLQTEREKLAALVQEIETEASRAEQEADRFRRAAGLLEDGAQAAAAAAPEASPEKAQEFAQLVAAALAAQTADAAARAAATPSGDTGYEGPGRAPQQSAAHAQAWSADDASEPAPAPRRPARAPDAFDADFSFDDDDSAPEPTRPAARRPERDAPSAPAKKPAAPSLDWEKFVRAANFPDSEDDRETLEALYAVLTDREAASLLQTAEDVLSTLADLNLFMEDMHVHHAPVELWSRFILDGDARNVLDLGGVRDPHAIEDVEFALNERPDFLKTAQAFFDQYETMARRLFEEVEDPALAVELANTRTGRAYMLIGRAEGRFGD